MEQGEAIVALQGVSVGEEVEVAAHLYEVVEAVPKEGVGLHLRRGGGEETPPSALIVSAWAAAYCSGSVPYHAAAPSLDAFHDFDATCAAVVQQIHELLRDLLCTYEGGGSTKSRE